MLSIRNLRKRFPRQGGKPSLAVDGVSFDVEKGHVFTLLGPSGCGKSTILHCIAGLETADEGEIRIGDKTVFSGDSAKVVPANLRNVGMIFQSYAIWPHMTVYENVAFPLVYGRKRYPAAEVESRVREVLDLVKLGEFADRPAPNLSGGQQQRVALARSLVHRPRLLLLDEPLSNLDAKLRESMRVELRQVVNHLGMTTIFVTHDQVEAMAMSDRIALLQAGRIIQHGTPRDIYLSPQTLFAADFMGRSNLIPGTVVQAGDKEGVETELGTLPVAVPEEFEARREVFVVIRPRAVELAGGRVGGAGVFTGKVVQISYLGDGIEAEVEIGSLMIRAILSPYAVLAEGEDVALHLPPAMCTVIARSAASVSGADGPAIPTASDASAR